MTLASFTDDDGNSLVLGQVYGFTIDEGSPSVEYVLGTASSSNRIVDMVRGVSVTTGTSSVSSLQKGHGRGAEVKITDAPVIMQMARILNGIGDLTNVIHYSSGVSTASIALDSRNLVNVELLNATAFGAIPPASITAAGFIELATGCEAASSTSAGGTGYRLVIPADMGTSSRNSAALGACKAVFTNNLGLIDGAWISTLTSNITMSGTLTYTGGATVFASSSVVSFLSSTTPTTTYTKPSNLKYVKVKLQGAGGNALNASGADAGGGGGAYCEKTIPAAALGATETLVVPGAGSKSPASFGSFFTALAGTDSTNIHAPGAGNTCTGSYDMTVPGAYGDEGNQPANGIEGGKGGDAFMGKGGNGISCNGNSSARSGTSGTGYGGGASGSVSACDDSPSPSTDVTGSPGGIWIEQFFY